MNFIYHILSLLLVGTFIKDVHSQFSTSTVINEGNPDCAQFWYYPNSLSAKCTFHKFTTDSGLISITLTGMKKSEITGDTELTITTDQHCKITVYISCSQNDSCYIQYFEKDGSKSTMNVGLLRFVIDGNRVSAEVAYDENETENIQTFEFYRCVNQLNKSNISQLQHEIKLALSKPFPGHTFEIRGTAIHKYRNDDQSEDVTTVRPYIETSTNHEVDENSSVTVEKMERTRDGKLLLDLIIKTKVRVPTSF